jgi:hypothetical protein
MWKLAQYLLKAIKLRPRSDREFTTGRGEQGPSMTATEMKQLKRTILYSVGKELNDHGFLLRSSKDSFVRKHDGVNDIFQLVFQGGEFDWCIQPNVGVRIDRIEDIFHKSSRFEPKYQSDTATIGASVGRLIADDSRACQFIITSPDEVPRIAAELVGVFHKYALPYFTRFDSVYEIDAELNNRPTKGTPHRVATWLRCATGAIVAKLVGRPDYKRLIDVYTDVMRKSDKGFYLGRFQDLVASLEAIDAEFAPPKDR